MLKESEELLRAEDQMDDKGSKNTNGNDPFELFPFRRFWIASAAAPGYGYFGWLHFDLFTCLRTLKDLLFSPSLFGFCLLQHHLPAVLSVVPFGSSFRDGVFCRILLENITCDPNFSLHGNTSGFAAFCVSPEVAQRDLRPPFVFPGLNSTF